ncbi:MAG: NINE protein, partial [Phycisphaerae bacterium]
IRRTVGIPGSGIFYTSHTGYHSGVHSGQHFATGETVPAAGRSGRNIILALLLCTLLGLLGAHQFYTGHIVKGVVMLVLTIMGWGLLITVPWMVLDLVLILTGQFHDRQDCRIAW